MIKYKRMEKTFLEIRDIKNIEKTNNILKMLPDFCSSFFSSIQNTTSTLTRLNYAHDLKLFFMYLTDIKGYANGNINQVTLKNLEDLKYFDFEQYLSWVSYYKIGNIEHKNSIEAKARKLASLRTFLKFLYKHDLILSNEINKVETPKLHEKPIIRLEPNEMCNVLDEVQYLGHFSNQNKKYLENVNARDCAIIYLFLSTGIRISELVGIDLEDLNLEENAFKITRKGGNSTIMYFPDEVKEILQKYYNQRLKIKPLVNHENAFFLSTQRKRICLRAVENLVKKYSKNVVQLKNITPHKLRSTFGTNLYRETQDIYVVATMLGHKDVNTTKKHYAAITEDIKKEASTKVKLKK